MQEGRRGDWGGAPEVLRRIRGRGTSGETGVWRHRGRPERQRAVVLVKSKQNRRYEFGEWEESWESGVRVEEDQDKGELREMIRCQWKNLGHGRDLGVGS